MGLGAVIEQEGIDNHGVWVPFEDGSIDIAAVGNPEYNAKRIQLEKQYRRKHNIAANKDLPEEVGEEMQRRAIFGTVCKGWKGEPFVYDAAEFPAIQEAMLREFQQSIAPPPQPPNGNGKGLLPFTEGNFLWYCELSRRFRKTVFAHASDDGTFDKANLDILGKT